ncbi:hypothetical protein Btru_018728 [Bulinus truncatus]|nr:hypothetical protein Btru_018728 [Bulinus truncatus]
MSTLLATHEEKSYTVVSVDENPVKEADDGSSSTLPFLKKLTIPLKKTEKSSVADSLISDVSNIPAAVLTSQKLMSPDLPPIVKIASPELEGVRIYSGVDAGSPAVSSTATVSLDIPAVSEASPASVLNAYHDLHKSGMQYLDPADDSIVFRQKVKKHKRRKHKSGSREVKEKDEDALSQVSDDVSQASDDISVTMTPNNTPAVDSPLETLKKADDFLTHMASILQDSSLRDKESDCGLPGPPNLGFQSELLNSEINGNETEAVDEKTNHLLENSSGTNSERCSLAEADQRIETQSSRTGGEVNVSVENVCSKSDLDIIDTALSNLEMAKSSGSLTKIALTESLESVKRVDGGISREQLVHWQDEYGEVKAIEAADPFKKNYKRSITSDDFYSHFLDTSPESPESPVSKAPRSPASAPIILPPLDENRLEMRDISQRSLANTWSEFTTPANIYSLVVSNTHIWFTDKSENIYYSSIGSPKGVMWRKASGKANQISVSPSGHIVWRLHHGVVHAGTKINSRHPEGMKWVEAIRDVEMICVDDKSGWYIKKNGQVMMQKGLSQDRPCYKSVDVHCPYRLKHIVCRQGVVWAITEGLKLVVRTGITDIYPEGKDWELDDRNLPPYLFSHVAIDHEKIGWAIDILGQIWFCDGVSRESPLGSELWWQLPLSEYILHDETTMDMIKAVAKKFDPTKLSYILSTNRGGLITAGTRGVWLALDFRNVLQVCRGSVQGYHWLLAQPSQISPSVTWKHVCANISHLDWGLVWAQQTKTSELYTFKRARGEANLVQVMSGHDDFCCISVSPTATWALTVKGEVKVRAGMGPHCPQGTSWVNLDMSQLGDAQFVHLSCNSLYVWAVEAEGVIYQRIGAGAPDENNLNPVWLPIETFGDIVFTRVHVGPLDWMVWAIDNRRLIYVRAGIKEDMPIGQEWIHVPGIQAIDLALTNSGVWALTSNGEIFFRYGISKERPFGDYWKKIPGIFTKISASANDELWGINREYQLMQCSLRSLTRQHEASDIPVSRMHSSGSVSDEIDWEIV